MTEVTRSVKSIAAKFQNAAVENKEPQTSGNFNGVRKVSKNNFDILARMDRLGFDSCDVTTGAINRMFDIGKPEATSVDVRKISFSGGENDTLYSPNDIVEKLKPKSNEFRLTADDEFLGDDHKVSVDVTHLHSAELEWDDAAVDIDDAERLYRDTSVGSLEWDEMVPAKTDSEVMSDLDMLVEDATLEAIAEALTGEKKLAEVFDDTIIALGTNVAERVILDHCVDRSTVAAKEAMAQYTQDLLQDGKDLDFVTSLENKAGTDKQEDTVTTSPEPAVMAVAQTKAERRDEHIARYRGNVKRLIQQFEGRGV